MTITYPRPDAIYMHCDFPQCMYYRIQGRQPMGPGPQRSESMMRTMLIDDALRNGWTLVDGKVRSTHFCFRHTPTVTKTYIPPVIT